MKLCRFQKGSSHPRVGLVNNDSSVTDLSATGIASLSSLLATHNLAASLPTMTESYPPRLKLSDIKLLPPVEQQEIWAAGVTYLRSKKARMEESDFSASAYDKVYDAPRPEIFFKSMPNKVVGSGDTVGIRKDARWNVPEPELALVLSPSGKVVGYTICNDMSSRDIEGENLLYLPQAKIYDRSCAIGPWIRVAATEEEARGWSIGIQILDQGKVVFSGETSVGQIKRSFDELAGYLFRSQTFPHGAILSTGTGIVPGDDFTLAIGQVVRINISGIGTLENTVKVV